MYDQEKNEITALKKYLLSQIPSTPLPPNNILLSPKSVALKAAVAGLDKELERLEREERLVRKFTNENTVGYSGSRAASSTSVKHKKNNDSADEDVAMEYVKMTKEDAENDTTTTTMKRENDVEDDWEEAEATLLSPSKKKPSLTDSQDLHETIAQKWASSTISRIAKADARVETPVGALGLALHTALIELAAVNQGNKKTEQMFRCTGVPDEAIIYQFLGEDIKKKKSCGGGGGVGVGGAGFAPPVRELPKGVLVPSNWEDMASKQQSDVQLIAFRYKCGQDVYNTSSGPTNDCTTLYLVLQVQDSSVRVSFGPMPAPTKGSGATSTTTTSTNQLQLPLTQHINLDGFQASKSKSSSTVQPSLFFISLPELLLQFGSTFGLISVMLSTFGQDTQATEEVVGSIVDAYMEDFSTKDMIVNQAGKNEKVDTRPNIPPDGPAVDIDPLGAIDSRTGVAAARRGDFEGDLLPGGMQPGLPGGPLPFGGSQVGPNHPIFDRSFGDDDLYYSNNQDEFGGTYGPPSFRIPGVGGSGSMRPRFDPFGPPGGPTEPGRVGRGGRGGGRFGSGRGGGRGRGRMPPGGLGDPNNDHMQPPNSDYFS